MRAGAPVPEAWPTPATVQRALVIPLAALTPIFKGGSRKDGIDEGRPFRGPSIRGALRYWWRATSEIVSVGELREREREIFGGVFDEHPRASACSVSLAGAHSTPGPRPEGEAYAYAFGVTGRPIETSQVHRDAKAQLRVEWRPGVAADVERAVRAWLLLGGTGGRSRRGAGSVWWDGQAAGGPGFGPPATLEEYLSAVRAIVPRRNGSPCWPTLAGGEVLVGPAARSADDAWKDGLAALKAVRASQGVDSELLNVLGRGTGREWKADDYLKIVAKQRFKSRRAALGLPIRFMNAGVLQAADLKINRFPSPIHFKVIRLGAADHRPAFVVVRTPMPHALTAGRVDGTLDPAGLDYFLAAARRLQSRGWESHILPGLP